LEGLINPINLLLMAEKEQQAYASIYLFLFTFILKNPSILLQFEYNKIGQINELVNQLVSIHHQ